MVARVSMDLDVLDRGLRQMVERTNALAGSNVRVGYQSDSGKVDGVDILDIAIWNHFGAPKAKIPARPFMFDAAIKYEGDLRKIMTHAAKKVSAGAVSPENALAQIGQYYQNVISAHIRSGEFKANAPSTIKKKKSAIPLVDKGRHLIPGLRYIVEPASGAPAGGNGHYKAAK